MSQPQTFEEVTAGVTEPFVTWAREIWDAAIASQQPIWMERIGELEAEIERLKNNTEWLAQQYEAVVEAARKNRKARYGQTYYSPGDKAQPHFAHLKEESEKEIDAALAALDEKP